MGQAQSNFSSVCPDLTYADYCGVVWQQPLDKCCGICPSPAIHSYGTLGGLILGSFFNLLIVLFQPATSAMYIAAQMVLGHMYLVAVMARNIMGSVSNGTNGLQLWHSEFAFLLAASSSGLVVASVLSDTHHIHGFGDMRDFNDYLIQDTEHKTNRLTTIREDKVYGPHSLHRQEHDEFNGIVGPKENASRGLQRLRKGASRNQAKLLLCFFAGSQLYWFILYATTVWWKNKTTFWQPQCDDFVGRSNILLVRAVSWTFSAIALLFTFLLFIPVLRSPNNRRTIAKLNKQKHYAKEDRRIVRVESAAGIILAVIVWAFWFISVMVISVIALRDFLLLGEPWPYAAIQNLMFGLFPVCKFFLGVVGSRRRSSYKNRKIRTQAKDKGKPTFPPHADSHAHSSTPPPTGSDSSAMSRWRRSRGRSATSRAKKETTRGTTGVVRALSQSRAAQAYGGGNRRK
ncbi:hypothetical protein JCM11251_000748 [Rhodosporidiobolus azoricus]